MAVSDIFQQWRNANERLKAAEDSMFRRSMVALDGTGEPLNPDDVEAVKHLRKETERLFGLVMAQLGKAIAELHGPLHWSQIASPTPPPQPG